MGRPEALVGGTRRGGGGMGRPVVPDTGGRGGIGRRGGAASPVLGAATSWLSAEVSASETRGSLVDSVVTSATAGAGAGGAGRGAGASGVPREEITRRAGAMVGSAGSSVCGVASPTGAAAFFAAAFLAGAFFAGAGSSGCTSRRSPSASALRRTRSACASSMEDE